MLNKHSNITALDIDSRDGDILVWIKPESKTDSKISDKDFDGLPYTVRDERIEIKFTVCWNTFVMKHYDANPW